MVTVTICGGSWTNNICTFRDQCLVLKAPLVRQALFEMLTIYINRSCRLQLDIPSIQRSLPNIYRQVNSEPDREPSELR